MLQLGTPRPVLGLNSRRRRIPNLKSAAVKAGLVALLRQRNPALTAEDFKLGIRRRREFNPNTGRGVPSWSMFVEG